MSDYRKRSVVLPTLSFKTRQVAFVKVLGEMVRGDRIEGEKDNKEPAMLAHVVDMQTGEEYNLICPTLLVSAWEKMEGGYVGKAFEVRVSAQPLPGKRYKAVTVYEVEPEYDYSGESIYMDDSEGEAE